MRISGFITRRLLGLKALPSRVLGARRHYKVNEVSAWRLYRLSLSSTNRLNLGERLRFLMVHVAGAQCTGEIASATKSERIRF